MSRMLAIASSLLASVLFASIVRGQETLRIGLVTTLTGTGASLGQELKNGWDLGIESVGSKIGGLPTEIFVVDDQLKTDVALAAVNKLIKQNKVQIVAGVLWSNILLAIYEPVLQTNTILMSTNAGPSFPAGQGCNRLYVSMSWQTEQFSEATAAIVNGDKIRTAYMIAPNYQAGKDIVAAFQRNFTGKIVGSSLFKLGETDFQSEFSVIRSKNPDAVVVFAPGAMAVAFLKQWHALQLSKTMKLYTISMIDNLSLPVIGDTVIGTSHTSAWDPTATNEANRRFLKSYTVKYGKQPTEYAALAYDGITLLDAAVHAVGGKLDDRLALVKAMRAVKFSSTRESFHFNINNLPIQNFYRREVVMGPDNKPMIRGAGIALLNHKDSYYRDCKLTW